MVKTETDVKELALGLLNNLLQEIEDDKAVCVKQWQPNRFREDRLEARHKHAVLNQAAKDVTYIINKLNEVN